MSQGQEAFTLLGGLILIGLGIFRLWSATADVSSMLPGIFFLIFGIIAILRDLRFRVVLSADSIEVHNLTSTRVLRRDEILGYGAWWQTRRAQIYTADAARRAAANGSTTYPQDRLSLLGSAMEHDTALDLSVYAQDPL